MTRAKGLLRSETGFGLYEEIAAAVVGAIALGSIMAVALSAFSISDASANDPALAVAAPTLQQVLSRDADTARTVLESNESRLVLSRAGSYTCITSTWEVEAGEGDTRNVRNTVVTSVGTVVIDGKTRCNPTGAVTATSSRIVATRLGPDTAFSARTVYGRPVTVTDATGTVGEASRPATVTAAQWGETQIGSVDLTVDLPRTSRHVDLQMQVVENIVRTVPSAPTTQVRDYSSAI